MILNMHGIDINLDDELDLYWFHEYLQWRRYRDVNSLLKSSLIEKRILSETNKVYKKKADTGSYDFAKPVVNSIDPSLWTNASDDFTMAMKKTDANHKTCIIFCESLAGHEWRMSHSFAHAPSNVYNLPVDILSVSESTFRFPESKFPSYLLRGCSDECDTIQKMIQQIRLYFVNKNYENVVIFGDSKHCGAVMAIALQMKDLVTHVFCTHGFNTYDWHTTPYREDFVRHTNSDRKNPPYHITAGGMMHTIKSYHFTKEGFRDTVINPLKYIHTAPFQVDYFYGKYDKEYEPFLPLAQAVKSDNFKMHEVDYKLAHEEHTHNIRGIIDRKVLPEYINTIEGN